MRSRRILSVCAGFLAAGLFHAPAAFCDTFEGNWNITVVPDSATVQKGGVQFADAMIFERAESAELLTENFAYLGFNAGPYVVTEEKPLEFTATMESGTKGRLNWTGIVSDGALRGSLTWTKPDGAVWVFSYTGQK